MRLSVCYIQQGDVCCPKCVHQNVNLRLSNAPVLRYCGPLLLIHLWILILRNICEVPLTHKSEPHPKMLQFCGTDLP